MKTSQFIIVLFLFIGAFYFGSSWQKNRPNPDQVVPVVEKSKSYIPPPKSNQRSVSPVTHITSAEEATIRLFEEVSPSVVYIATTEIRQSYWSMNELEVPRGSGSGFVWDKNGHIVTNYHVIEGADSFEITLADQSVWKATFVGAEPYKDLAVLKIEAPADSLEPIKLGSYADLKVGQSVYAIGNPFGLDHSLSTGVISALGREITSISGRPIRDVIQTDAAINPGNSGGPLLDSSGRIIGVNTMIYSPSGASAGIGFSIPVDVVNWVVPDVIEFGEVKRPVMGVDLVPEQYVKRWGFEQGAMILSVQEGSGADKAGLMSVTRKRNGEIQLGDIIIAVAGQTVNNNNDLILALEQFQPGDEISVVYLRKDKENEVPLTLGSSIR